MGRACFAIMILCLTGCETQGTTDASCQCSACDVTVDCDTTCEHRADADSRADADTIVRPEGGDIEAFLRILEARRSLRDYTDESLTLDDVESLLWAAQGITLPGVGTGRDDAVGFRTSPSAGATYPLELYVAVDRVDGMEPGLYWYNVQDDAIEPTGIEGPMAQDIADAALGQAALRGAAAIFIFTSIPERTTARYGLRGNYYIDLEVGHAAQNLLLMVAARGLGACPFGAFDDDEMALLLETQDSQYINYLISVGRI